MPDDRARLSRFSGERRTDIAMGERVLRFALAVQDRMCRELAASEPTAVFAPRVVEHQRGSTLVLEGGEAFRQASVAATRFSRGSTTVTGLAVDLLPADSGAPAFAARLHHVAPGSDVVGWFEGAVTISPAGADGEHFEDFWRHVAGRHSDIVDFDGMRQALASAGAADAAGFAFDHLQDLDGTGEKAFLFVRDVGRALLAGWSLVGRG